MEQILTRSLSLFHLPSDFMNMSYVLQTAIATPFINEPSVYKYVSAPAGESVLTNLQTEVMVSLEKIQQLTFTSNLTALLPLLVYQYLAFSLYAVNISMQCSFANSSLL